MKNYFSIFLLLALYGSNSFAQANCPQLNFGGKTYWAGDSACFGPAGGPLTFNTCGGDGKWIFSSQQCKCNNPWTSGGENGWYGCSSDWSSAANEPNPATKTGRLLALFKNNSKGVLGNSF